MNGAGFKNSVKHGIVLGANTGICPGKGGLNFLTFHRGLSGIYNFIFSGGGRP